MAAVGVPRTLARVNLDPAFHLTLIDGDLDSQEKSISDFTEDVSAIRKAQSRQLWATATLTVSLITTTIGLFLNLRGG